MNITQKQPTRNNLLDPELRILLAQHRDLLQTRRAIDAELDAIVRRLREYWDE